MTTTQRISSARRLAAAALALGLLAAACGDDDTTTAGDGDATETPTEAPTSGEDGGGEDGEDPAPAERTVIFSVFVGGGFVPAEIARGEAPYLVVMSDGTIFRAGAQIAIFPPPATPAVESAPLSADELAAVQALIEENAALFGADYGQPPIADAPFTEVRAVIDGEVVTAQAMALDLVDAGAGLTSEQAANRAALSALIADVQALIDGTGREWALTPPPALRISSSAWVNPDPSLDPGPARDFPLADAALVPAPDAGFGCVEISGADIDTVYAAIADTTTSTPWLVEGSDSPLQLIFAPVYEAGTAC